MDSDQPDPILQRCLQNHRLSINWLSFSPNSKYLASASDDKNVILWSVGADKRDNVSFKFAGHTEAVTSVALTNSILVSGSKDNTARLWRLADRIKGSSHSSVSSIYRCHQAPIRSVDINADQSYFCTSSDDKTVKIWSVTSTNKFITTLSGEHTNWVRQARYSKLCPNLLASCGDDGVICIWDTRTKEAAIRLTYRRRITHYWGIQWHPTCEYIMSSASSDSSIRLWDLRYEKAIQCYTVHDTFVSSTDFHSSGNYLLSASHDSTCKILDVFEGRPLITMRAHTGPVHCAQFSPDGEHFATAGQDRAILYWKSNLQSLDDCTDDDDDVRSVRSLAFDPTTPPIHSFDTKHEIKSIRGKMNNVKLESNSEEDDLCSFQTKLSPTSTAKSSPTAKSITNEPEEPRSETDSSDLNLTELVEGGGAPLDSQSSAILQMILKSMYKITDSIENIDNRLKKLETKVELALPL